MNQEAHAQDIWPIGYGAKSKPSTRLTSSGTLAARIANAQVLLTDYPSLAKLEWYVDTPTDSLYHVGGEFNDRYHVWPHKYLIFKNGKLVFRSPFRSTKTGHYIDIRDLEIALTALK